MGFKLDTSYSNTIHHNNFIDNDVQVSRVSSENTWHDESSQGNYWSNYNGTDRDGDGIGDTELPHNGVDFHPLTEPNKAPDNGWSIFSDSVALGLVLAMVILVFMVLEMIRRILKISEGQSDIEDKDEDEEPGEEESQKENELDKEEQSKDEPSSSPEEKE
jgi:hypothetical protein